MGIKEGDKVEYQAGRGMTTGTVEALKDGVATIRTGKGKLILRKVETLKKVG